MSNWRLGSGRLLVDSIRLLFLEFLCKYWHQLVPLQTQVIVSVPGELLSLRWVAGPWEWQLHLISTIYWPSQATRGSFVCYWSIIELPCCAAPSLRGCCCHLQFFSWNLFGNTGRIPWRQLEGPDVLRRASSPRGTKTPPKLPPPTHIISVIHVGTQSSFGLIFSCPPPPCARDFLLEGRGHGGYTWHMWRVSSMERHRRVSPDQEAERAWIRSWINLYVSSDLWFRDCETLA